MFKLVLEKAEEPEIKLPTSAGSWKKQESSRKTLLPKVKFFTSVSKKISEKAMAPHSSTLAWKIPGTRELGGLPSMGLHRVGHE